MSGLSRRTALTALGGGLLASALPLPSFAQTAQAPTRANSSGFKMIRWQDHFDQLGKGVIIADLNSRALHYWGPNGSDYMLFPTSIPLSEDLTRRGVTEIVRKREGPDWTPTASMRQRDPTLPAYMPPGADNPLGTHAMYLTWPAYLIHGTHDTRKIGRKSSSGCVGLYNEHIAQLFAVAQVGTRVLLL